MKFSQNEYQSLYFGGFLSCNVSLTQKNNKNWIFNNRAKGSNSQHVIVIVFSSKYLCTPVAMYSFGARVHGV